MHRALPLHPSLEQLKKQAKDLRKGHQSASAEAAERIKESLPRLSDATVEEILQGHFSLQEAQHVIACEYGCKHWEMLCGVVDADLNVLAGLSDVHIQELLREVDQKDCTRAFNGAGQIVGWRFLGNMSRRVAVAKRQRAGGCAAAGAAIRSAGGSDRFDRPAAGSVHG